MSKWLGRTQSPGHRQDVSPSLMSVSNPSSSLMIDEAEEVFLLDLGPASSSGMEKADTDDGNQHLVIKLSRPRPGEAPAAFKLSPNISSSKPYHFGVDVACRTLDRRRSDIWISLLVMN